MDLAANRFRQEEQMSTNRRKFLKVGTLAALAAVIPFKAAGQGMRKGDDGNPIDRTPPELTQDALANYNKAAFASYLNTVFRLYARYSTVDVTLVEIKDLLPAGGIAKEGAECFSLMFRGGSVVLPQNTYKIDHPSLGRFQVFLVPGGPDDKDVQRFIAIINRVSYSRALESVPHQTPKSSAAVRTITSRPPAGDTTPTGAGILGGREDGGGVKRVLRF
jgi:hypothetical protein